MPPQGVCPEPMSWETLRLIVADGSLEQMRRLGRSPETLQSYREFKARIANFYASVRDMILIKVFGREYEVNSENKFVAVEGTRATRATRAATGPFFVPNDFPYNMEPGIKHWLLWSDHAMRDGEVEAFLRSDPSASSADARLTFVNPVELQSIPDIHHVHVLLLFTDRAAEPAVGGDVDAPPPMTPERGVTPGPQL